MYSMFYVLRLCVEVKSKRNTTVHAGGYCRDQEVYLYILRCVSRLRLRYLGFAKFMRSVTLTPYRS
jgi:hypothetical protein